MEFSAKAAEILKKQKEAVMASYQSCYMLFGGTEENTAYIDLQSINGFTKEQCRELCNSFFKIVCNYAMIDASRVYFNFYNVEPVCAWKFIEGNPVCPDFTTIKRRDHMDDCEWNIRNFMNPVVTRLLIYGINPIDLEYVLRCIEQSVIINTQSLEKKWRALWEGLAKKYITLAEDALSKKNVITAQELFMTAAQCYFAIFLVNQSNIEDKKQNYMKLVSHYAKAANLFPVPVEKVEIPFSGTTSLSAYLHLPSKDVKKKGSVIFFSGLGSCKEEMHTIARTITDRGITVLIPDMPGCGESLFNNDIKCSIDNVKQAFCDCLSFLKEHESTKDSVFGSAGLCMGGGYAYKAAALHKEFSFCATLFPLFIAQVPILQTPQWMKSGDWYNYQTGGVNPELFQKEMCRNQNEKVTCPFLLIHGKHDNWMTIHDALELFDVTETDIKEKIIIQDKPVFSNEQTVIHTMPVGEQMHWIRHIFADWISQRV